jgi:mannose-1-phosphate guanylyltransferase/mannose-6-phosphate isomerase
VRIFAIGIDLKHVKKPWGSFDEYTLNERSTVKILTINPGASTSLQSHRHRKEFWVALDKGIRVQIGKEKILLRKGSNILAKKGVKHRLQCEGRLAARILEISFGEFAENDIVRYEDDYGRVTAKISRKR